MKNREGLVPRNTYHVMWMQVDVGWSRGGRAVPNYKFMHIKSESEFPYCTLSRMKTSMLFECGLLPPMSTSCPTDVIHVINVPRPSSFFASLPLLCIILNAN